MAILFSDSVGITDKYIWFVSHDGIFSKVNKLTGELEIIHTDIQEFVDFGNSVDNILNINNRLYIVNQIGSKMLQYDIEENSFKPISIPIQFDVVNWGCFSLFEKLGDNICLLARDLSIALLYDVKQQSFSRDTKLEEMMRQQGIIESGKQNFEVVVYENILYFIGKCTGKILLWDWQKKVLVDSFLCKEEDEWCSACIDKDYILLLSVNGVVYIFDKSSFKLVNIVNIGNKIRFSYKGIIETRNKYFVLPSLENDIFVIDKKDSNLVHKLDVPSDFRKSCYPPDSWSKFHGITKYKNEIWAANRMYNYYLCIDVMKDRVNWLKIQEIALKDILDYLVINKRELHEQLNSLESFCKYENHYAYKARNSQIGEAIWNRCKG